MKPAAIFTVVQDEPEFLPHWLAWYGRAGDTYILDHASEPPVPGGIRVAHELSWDYAWLHALTQEWQARLLAEYRVVVFATPDEFLVPHAGSLRAYLEHLHAPSAAGMGYDVVDMHEPPIEWAAPLLPQRHWWTRQPSYDKPLIVTEPKRWTWGFHPGPEDATSLDTTLWLIHLHRIDYANAKVRHARKHGRPLHTDITVSGSGSHNLFTRGDEYERWFYGDRALAEPIPEAAKRL